jgi:DNA replication protein DnaC
MMTLSELHRYFKLLTDPQDLSESEKSFLQRFLSEEQKLREKKRIEYLLRQSGIKRIKLLKEFDWAFNPKIPRDKILEFQHPMAQKTFQPGDHWTGRGGQNPHRHRPVP